MNPYSHTYDQRWSAGDPTSVENLDIAREGVDHVKWILDNAGIGGAAAIYQHPNEITEDVAIPAGIYGLSAGPITIASGITVTVESGATWTVV